MLCARGESDERAEERMGRESDAFESVISILLVKYEQFEASYLAQWRRVDGSWKIADLVAGSMARPRQGDPVRATQGGR
jgi:hypothetical protein